MIKNNNNVEKRATLEINTEYLCDAFPYVITNLFMELSEVYQCKLISNETSYVIELYSDSHFPRLEELLLTFNEDEDEWVVRVINDCLVFQ